MAVRSEHNEQAEGGKERFYELGLRAEKEVPELCERVRVRERQE